ncbi:MAG: hypothetical protein B7Z37_04580 [Verrucomicrobia bacterium 12-59-8]|nr:MAG: hypothetical protein B7Z37_04580 [Verrucomicrobia bacterium 12-59-8]
MKNLLCCFALLTVPLATQASVIITYAEDPNSTLSSLKSTQVFNFNSLSGGTNKNVVWDGVGTFNQLFIKSADAYGGAADALNPKGSLYSLQGAGTPVLSSTLKLDTPSSYFGMWWSAGDAKNVLEFYNGDTLLGRFTTSSLMDPLPASYDGNPLNRKINSGEPYGFINFFADETTAWNRIVLTNDGSSGFESDNYTTRVAAWDPLVDGALPGVPVAIVEGKTTTAVTEKMIAGTRWSLDATSVAAIPGAPAPPWWLLVVFATIFITRGEKSMKLTA